MNIKSGNFQRDQTVCVGDGNSIKKERMMAQISLRAGRTCLTSCLAALLLGACGQAATASSAASAPPSAAIAATHAPSPSPARATAPAAVAGPQITIDNFTFSPSALTVAAGTTVTWINHDDVPHTVTAQDHTFTSSGLDTDDHFSHQFTIPGTYTYYCTIHPKMTATIIVR
jgi:plastocyanin